MRAVKFILNLAILAVLTIGPYWAFQFFWKWAGPDIVCRMGYLLWLSSSLEEAANQMRVRDLREVAAAVTPVMLSIAGAGWGVLRLFGRNRPPKRAGDAE